MSALHLHDSMSVKHTRLCKLETKRLSVMRSMTTVGKPGSQQDTVTPPLVEAEAGLGTGAAASRSSDSSRCGPQSTQGCRGQSIKGLSQACTGMHGSTDGRPKARSSRSVQGFGGQDDQVQEPQHAE